jgi:Putative sensor
MSARAAAGRAGARGNDAWRQRLHGNPFRLAWSAAPWTAAGYLAGYLAVSWVLFSVAFTSAAAAAVLAITLAGLPLLVAASAAVRGCANVGRGLLRQVLAEPVRGAYREAAQPGVVAQVRTRWQDVATWRDLAYLIGLWLPLNLLGTVAVAIWLTFLAGVTLPIWYWAPRGNAGIGYVNGTRVHGVALGYFPHGPHGPGGVGLFVDSLPKALLAAVGFLSAFLLFNYVIVAAARAHARVARSLLRAPADPLAEAKGVLLQPGPLGLLARPAAQPASSAPPTS